MKLNKGKISFAHRVICFLLAVYLFNFSIDSRDALPDTVAEDLSINDIESFFEFMAENIMGIENAVEEHDERDRDDGGAFEFKKYYSTNIITCISMANAYCLQSIHALPYREAINNRSLEIIAPPPRG